MRLVFGWIFAGILILSSPLDGFGHTFGRIENGEPLKWERARRLLLFGRSGNNSNVLSDEFYQATVKSLRSWEAAAGNAVAFDYWQGSDNKDFPANQEYNGRSSLFFLSQQKGNVGEINNSVVGLTQVWFNTDTGEIYEADVVLNDVDFEFVTDAAMAFQGRFDQVTRKVFLDGVLTHELGHAFGLSHSATLQSSMLFTVAPEQDRPSCDDQAGLRSLYMQYSHDTAGSIAGEIMTESGQAVFGAQVLLLEHSSGKLISSTLTALDGRYQFIGVPPGHYHVMVEPFSPGPLALPSYYRGINAGECGVNQFRRTAYLDLLGRPEAIRLNSFEDKVLPAVRVRCGGRQADFRPLASETLAVSDIAQGVSRVGSLGSAGQSIQYTLDNLEGDFVVNVLGFSLYSLAGIRLELRDSRGAVVQESTVQSPLRQYASGFKNHDGRLIARGLKKDRYELILTRTDVQSTAYPAAAVSLDSSAFAWVLMGQQFPDQSALLSEDPRCEITLDKSQYQSPKTYPALGGNTSANEADTSGCLNLAIAGQGTTKAHPSNMLPWIFLIFFYTMRKKRFARGE